MTAGALRIAVVGCGAVAERYYIPALGRVGGLELVALVDADVARARRLVAAAGRGEAHGDVAQCLDAIDAAILALPNHLHAPIGMLLASRGKHVFVEKPLATTAADCAALDAVARRHAATIGVGMTRRHLDAHRLVAAMLASGMIGDIGTFDVEEGVVYGWPLTTDYAFRRELAGGGVLMDTGSHVLDTLVWWLGDLEVVGCNHDALGGVEADVRIELSSRSGARGVVTLSRLRKLRNTLVLEGSRGRLEVAVASNQMSLAMPACGLALGDAARPAAGGVADQSTVDVFTAQLTDWHAAIRERRRPLVDAGEAGRSIALIEACYRQAKRQLPAWRSEGLALSGGGRPA